MKTRLISLVCALAMALAMFPVAAFAEEPPVVKLEYIVEYDGEGQPEFLHADDKIKVSVYATPPSGYFWGGSVNFDFDPTVLEPQKEGRNNKGGVGPDYEDVLDDKDPPLYSAEDNARRISGQFNNLYDDPPEAPQGRHLLYTFYMQVKSELPDGIEKGLIIQPESIDFRFGGDGTLGTAVKAKMEDSIVNPYKDAAFDTVPPQVLVDGTAMESERQTYYSQPLKVSASDKNGPCTIVVVQGGDPDNLTAGNTVVTYNIEATDRAGMTARVSITIDAAAFNAAQEALDALTGSYVYGETDKDIEEAERLKNAVDPTAQGKLHTTNLESAKETAGKIKSLIDTVKGKVQALQGLKASGAAPDEIFVEAVALKPDVDRLVAASVPGNEFGYDEYMEIYSTVEGDIAEIGSLQKDIGTLAGDIGKTGMSFDYEDRIEKLNGRIKTLSETYEDNTAKVLGDAQTTMNDINAQYAALVEEWNKFVAEVNAKNYDKRTITMADKADINGLVEKFNTKFADKGKTLEDVQMTALKGAVDALAEVEIKRAELTEDVENLHGEADAHYYDDEECDKLQKRVEALGDTFTAEEQKKIDACRNGVAALKTRMSDFVDEMKAHAENDVTYADKAVLKELPEEIEDLESRDCPLKKEGVYTYLETYEAAVKAMEKEIEDCRQEMNKALETWKYNGDMKPYEEIQGKMRDLGSNSKYNMNPDEFAEAFPNYNKAEEMQQEAEKLLAEVTAAVKKLPKTVTLENEGAVQSIADKVKTLRDTYHMTDEELSDALTEDVYKDFTNAVSTIEKLRKEKEEADRKAKEEEERRRQEEANKNAQTQQVKPAPTPAPAPAPVAVTTIPRTADDSNTGFVWVTFLASALMLAACCVKLYKRKE